MRCEACPISPGLPCPSASHPAYCRHVAGPEADYWKSRLIAKAGGPAWLGTIARPQSRDDSRINVGLVAPQIELKGGAERVHKDVFDAIDPARFRVIGSFLHTMRGLKPALESCDVVITWGVPSWREVIPCGPSVILVSHMSCDWTRDVVRGDERADVLVAIHDKAVEPFSESGRRRAIVIPNVVAPGRVAPEIPRDEWRGRCGIPQSAFLSLFAGRMCSDKRPDVALGASRPDGAWLVLCGEGELKSSVEALAGPRVVFLGLIDDVGSALYAADCLVQPSVTEGLSLASLEAMAAGLPVIATPTGLYVDRPDLARVLPQPPTARDVARAVEADRSDPMGTHLRRGRALEYVRDHADHGEWARSWERAIEKAFRRKGKASVSSITGFALRNSAMPSPGCR